MSREGGTVGVLPGVAGEGVQNRPPRTKSPSRHKITLQRGYGGKNTLQGGLKAVESAFYRRKCPPGTGTPSSAKKGNRIALPRR